MRSRTADGDALAGLDIQWGAWRPGATRHRRGHVIHHIEAGDVACEMQDAQVRIDDGGFVGVPFPKRHWVVLRGVAVRCIAAGIWEGQGEEEDGGTCLDRGDRTMYAFTRQYE